MTGRHRVQRAGDKMCLALFNAGAYPGKLWVSTRKVNALLFDVVGSQSASLTKSLRQGGFLERSPGVGGLWRLTAAGVERAKAYRKEIA